MCLFLPGCGNCLLMDCAVDCVSQAVSAEHDEVEPSLFMVNDLKVLLCGI